MSTNEYIQLDIYVNYPGNCEQAFRFYEQHLGGKITMMMTHEQAPETGNRLPADWKNAILHARMAIGNTMLMGADIPNAEPMRSAYLTLRFDSAKEAERVYALLSSGGQIFMKMEETFFASRFLDNNKSVSEIAYELGFKYPQHFIRLFKQKVGVSPNEYRTLN